MLKKTDELLNNDISETASVNRMVFFCFFLSVVIVSLAGVPVYWGGKMDWKIIDPLFYYLSLWIPLLLSYYLYIRRKDSLSFKFHIYGSLLVFYAFVMLTGKNYVFSFLVLPMMMALIGYANLKFSVITSSVTVLINGISVMVYAFGEIDYQELKYRITAFCIVGITALYMNVCSYMVVRRQEKRIEETDREKDRFKAIVSVGISKIFEYDIKEDLAMFTTGSSGEYGIEKYLCNFSSVAKQHRYIQFSDWYKFDEIMQEIVSGAGIIEKELRVRESGEDFIWYKIKGRVIYDEKGNAVKVIGSMEDVDEEKKLEFMRADEKMRDSLTKLYVKPFINNKVDDALKEDNSGTLSGLFIIDIDDFEKVNDEMGTAFGDEILKNMAEDITKLFYDTDLLGRLGSDEFVVLMRNVENVKDIERKVKEIQRVIADTYVGDKSNCTVSIGVSVYPNDGQNYEELYIKADKALRLAWSKGRNHYDVYDSIKENVYRTLTGENSFKSNREVLDTYNYGIDSLAELAFKLIDESKDTDSAINLLIRQIVRQMQIEAVVIKEKSGREPVMTTLYEYGMEDSISNGVGAEVRYTDKQWDDMAALYKYSGGVVAVSDLEQAAGKTELQFMLAMGIESYVSVAYYDKGEFVGTMDFINFSKEKYWNEEDKNIFKTITNVVSSYLLKMKAFETASETVERLTGYDAVTGLYKYEKFLVMASEYIESAKHGNYAFLYMDICNFKYLNDAYGYERGDYVLKDMADTIVSYEQVVMASRVFSDNMVALVKFGDVNEDKVRNIFDKAARTFSDNIHKQFVDSRPDVRIGVCTFSISGQAVPIKNIISNANLARKRAKQPGMPRIIFYDEQMGFDVKSEITYANNMEAAFHNKEFVVYMQPKVNLKTNRIEGAEALIRWCKEDGNIIYPNDFIPVFEKNKSVTLLDYYVYDEVCKYIRHRLDNNLPVVRISVNVSRVHLYSIDDIIDYIKGLLTRYDIPPEYLEFELTETSFTDKVDDTISLMQRLRKLGVKVSMDDFGSGYSSLNVLTKLPLDVLKLDKEFMRDFETDSEEKIVIPSLIDMAKKLNLDVVCEGVETDKQVEFLREVGCDYVQGFYYSKPIPQEEFDEMLSKQN